MAALDDFLSLMSVRALQDVADFAGRPHDIPRVAMLVGGKGHESHRAEAYPLSITGETPATPFHQPKRPNSLENHLTDSSAMKPSSIIVLVLFAPSSEIANRVAFQIAPAPGL
jgi:hypothetical protein